MCPKQSTPKLIMVLLGHEESIEIVSKKDSTWLDYTKFHKWVIGVHWMAGVQIGWMEGIEIDEV